MSDQVNQFLNNLLAVINHGLGKFSQNLEDQNVEVVRVDWKPPAGGDQEMISILDQLL